jgi:hypothetical protein
VAPITCCGVIVAPVIVELVDVVVLELPFLDVTVVVVVLLDVIETG